MAAGVFTLSNTGLQGALIQMLAHGNNPHIIFQVGDSKLNSGFTMPLVVESEQRDRLSSHN
jgi:hypothetical protein